MHPASTPEPTYGASAHYQKSLGEVYFLAQAEIGQLGAHWNLYVWKKYISPEDSILDFGCGGGYLLSVLPGRSKVGVEINPAARRVADANGIQVYETIHQVSGTQFTRVISNHALEHIPAPLTALKELRSCLDPQGKLLLLLPLDDWRTAAHRQYRKGEIHHHLYAWTPQNLGNLLAEAGFREISVKIISDAMPPNMKLAGLLLRHQFLRLSGGKLFSLLLRRRQLFARATP
jgi:SAM-dependent methyltransferase